MTAALQMAWAHPLRICTGTGLQDISQMTTPAIAPTPRAAGRTPHATQLVLDAAARLTRELSSPSPVCLQPPIPVIPHQQHRIAANKCVVRGASTRRPGRPGPVGATVAAAM
jgi:hypothetical protein